MAARPRPGPALIDDLITEILLHLPPDDTACLARASLVCKAWRRLLADRVFLRRYREIHGAAPVLCLLYNNFSTGASGPLFLPTTQTSPFPSPAASATSPTYCRTVDCRHGRVLLHHPGYYPSSFNVWDPISGKQRCFSAPKRQYEQFTAAVLCASNGGCDHISCSGGPFLVVLVDKTLREDWPNNNLEVHWQWQMAWPRIVAMAQASLYSSETGKWIVSASTDFDSFTGTSTPSLLAGDTLFFLVNDGSRRILKHDPARGVLSVIQVPPIKINHVENMILCTAEDGGLGVAAVVGCSLHLLSGRTDTDGVMRWARDRTIELDSIGRLMMSCVSGASTRFCVVGFAEGTGYIFVRADDSVFSVELKSSRISRIGSGKFGIIFPFMRF